jgi:S-formylglutathione hydrolase FrmB
MRDLAVLGIAFAPPSEGRHTVEVRTRGAGGESVATYRFSVAAPDALAPVALRDPSGAPYVIAGSRRRRVPDETTLQLLGYAGSDVRSASASFIAALPDGEPLPALRDGDLVRASGGSNVFRLSGGMRALATAEPDAAVREVERIVLQTVKPDLSNGLLVQGALPDVYHVDRLSLRKIPSWKWLEERGIRASEPVYVPDRIIAALPQNSPHWIQPGGTWMDRSFYSEMLGRFMPYRVYLPAGYGGGSRRYPVLYLLHGQSGRYDEWSGYGAEAVANELQESGKLGPVIMVAPQGGLGYWMNQDGGTLGRGTPWGDFVAKDLVRHVDDTYRTLAQRERRAIGGLSMGGHGAIQLALNYPTVFGVAGAHSPSIRPEGSAPAYFGTGSFFDSRDPLRLIERAELNVRPPRIWIDAGASDPWRPAAEALHKALEERGWAHEWRVFAGEHDGWYWGDHIWEYLPFYGTALSA